MTLIEDVRRRVHEGVEAHFGRFCRPTLMWRSPDEIAHKAFR